MAEYLSGIEVLGQGIAVAIESTRPLQLDSFATNHTLQRSGHTPFRGGFWCTRNQHVTNFSCRPVFAVDYLTVDENSGCYPRSNRQKGKITNAASGAPPVLANRRQSDVIFDRRWNVQSRFQQIAEGHIAPSP